MSSLATSPIQEDPTSTAFPVGSIVFIADPTHNHWNITKDVYGFVYETYVSKGCTVYVVLCKKEQDLYDMKDMRPSTMFMSSDICCQHLDADRLRVARITHHPY
jgi:hypothetical protein